LVPPKDAGWKKDGTSGGFQLISADDDSDPDIIFTDKIDTRSSRADGATMLKVPGGERGFYLVLSVYPRTGTVEHYLFRLDDRGNGTVVWGTTRSGTPFKKSSVIISECSAP
jgi:hypothetical protein